MPSVHVLTEATECIEFARDTWSLENAALLNDQGLFMYLQDVLIVDQVPVAPRLSAMDHLQPNSPATMKWWDERRRLAKLDDALQNESRVFCDPRYARDASEDERIAAQLKKRDRPDEFDSVRSKRFRKQDDFDSSEPSA